jgi:GTP cyclohydrolase I
MPGFRIEVAFPYFVRRTAPVSRAASLMGYECSFAAEACPGGDDFVLGVKVPVATLCPCSKAISEYGAHNQWG